MTSSGSQNTLGDSPSEESGRFLSPVPLAKRHLSLPQVLERGKALVHLLLRCLRAVTAECAPGRRAIALVERNLRGKQRRRSRVHVEPEPSRTVRDPIGCEPDEVKPSRWRDGACLEKLRHDIANQSVVRVAVAAFR